MADPLGSFMRLLVKSTQLLGQGAERVRHDAPPKIFSFESGQIITSHDSNVA